MALPPLDQLSKSMLNGIRESSSLRWVLSLGAILAAATSIILPLNSALLEPGFTSIILLRDPAYLVGSFIFLILLGILWVVYGDTNWVSLLAVLAFFSFMLDVWVLKVPGRSLGTYPLTIYSTWLAGHMQPTLPWGSLIGSYTLYPFLGELSGLTFSETMTAVSLLKPLVFGIFSYLFVRLFVKSPRLACLGAILSVISDLEISKAAPTGLGSNGILFFLVMLYIVAATVKISAKRYVIPLVLSFAASVITYPPASIVIVLMFLMSNSASWVRQRFRHSTARAGLPTIAILFLLALVGWVVFSLFGIVATLSYYLKYLLALSHPASGTAISGGAPLTFYLVRILGSNLTSLPYYISYLIPAWFLVLVVGGGAVWLYSFFRSRRVVPWYMVMSVAAFGILLFLEEGGAEFTRDIPYAAIILSVVFVQYSKTGRLSILKVVAFALVLALTVPTVIAYYPDVGTFAPYFPTELAGGSFLGTSIAPGGAYYSNQIYSFQESAYASFNNPTPTGPATSNQAVASILDATSAMQRTRGSLFLVTPFLYLRYEHAYGSSASIAIRSALDNLTKSNAVVYSNGQAYIIES